MSQNEFRSQALIERFDLLPGVHDEDSIFSESSSDELAGQYNARSNNDEYFAAANGTKSGISCFTVPKLQPREESKTISTQNSLNNLRRRLEEEALLEAMSSPGRSLVSLRQSQAAPAPCAGSSKETHEHRLLNDGDLKTKSQLTMRDTGDFYGSERRGISQRPCLGRRHNEIYYGLPFSQLSTSLQPGPRRTRTSAFTEIGVQLPFDEFHEDIGTSFTDRPQNLDTYLYKATASYAELTPKPCESSHSDSITSPSESASQSSYDSEVKYHNTPKVRSLSCHSTAYTAETSTADISSKDSSDSSEKSNDTGIGADECKCSGAAVDKAPATVIFNLVKQDSNEACEGANIKRKICDREAGGASTPRSALLEKCGWSHHHRFARQRAASSLSATTKQPVTIVPLHHLSSAILVKNDYMHDEVSILEEKKELINELDELKHWKVRALEELDEKTHEVEALKQCAANHADEMELMNKEVAKKEEQHVEEMSRLKSQMSILQNRCNEKQGMIDSNVVQIRELEHVLERTKSLMQTRDMELCAKDQVIDDKNAEIDELKLELASLMNEKIGIAKEADDLKSWKIVAEKSMNGTAQEILALSNRNEKFRELIRELESQVKSSNQKNDAYCSDIANLKSNLELKCIENDKLRAEVENSTLAIAECRDEISSLRCENRSLSTEIETAHLNILESTEEISSLRSDIKRQAIDSAALSAEVRGYQEKVRVLQDDNLSLFVKLESSEASCKELSTQVLSYQDQLKAAEKMIDESRDEAHALRTKLESREAANKILNGQTARYQEQLRAAEDVIAETREEKSVLAASLDSVVRENENLRKYVVEQRSDICERSTAEIEIRAEINELKSWKLSAQASMESSGKEMEGLYKKNQELLDQMESWKQRFEAKTSECERLLLENMNHIEEIKEVKATLAETLNRSTSIQENLRLEFDNIQHQLIVQKDEYEGDLSLFQANASKESAMHAEIISTLKSEISAKTSEITKLAAKVDNQCAEITTLQKELDSAKKDLVDTENGVDELKQLLAQSKTAIESREAELQSKKEEYEGALSLLQANASKESEIISTLKSEITAKTSEITELTAKVENQSAEISTLQEECDSAKKDLVDTENEVHKLKYLLAKSKTAVESTEAELQSKKEEYEEALSLFQANASKESAMHAEIISKLESEIFAKTSEITVLTAKVENQSVDISTLQKELDSAIKDLVDTKNEVEELTHLLTQSKSTIESREAELQRKTAACDGLAAEIKVYQHKLKVADDDYISLRHRFESLLEISEEFAKSKKECEALKVKVSELEQQLSNEEMVVINYEITNLKKTNAALSSKVKDVENEVLRWREEAGVKSEETRLILEDLAESKSNCEELQLTVNSKTEEIFQLQNTVISLRHNVTSLSNELAESKRVMNSKNKSLEADVASKSEEILMLQSKISALDVEIQKLQSCIDHYKQELKAERGPRLEALCQLEQDCRAKEDELSQQLIVIKNASTEVSQAEARYMAAQLLNESLSIERDELVQWKHDAEEKLQNQSSQIKDLASQASSLRNRCNELEEFIEEQKACIEDLEQRLKSASFAIVRFEEDFIATSKEISLLKDKVNSKHPELEALNDEVRELRLWKEEARADIRSKSKDIKALTSEKEDLELKIQELSSREQSLLSQIRTANEEKMALAKSSLDMAGAYEEKMKCLKVAAERALVLEMDLKQQRCRHEQAQNVVKALEQALLTVEKERKKLLNQSS